MNESAYTDRLSALWPVDGEASAESLKLADEAVKACPNSVRLWIMRGNLIELGPDEPTHTLDDALFSYERAIAIDPNCAEAFEEVGHFYDAVLDEPVRARQAFAKAKSIRSVNE